jgi:UDP-N-acetyl-L-fucosamine synthase
MRKVMTILGTRPEMIRLSCVISELDNYFDHILVHTGQNTDANMKQVFFDDLGIRAPDYSFEMNSANLGMSLSVLFARMSEIFELEKPDALVLLGDTNSGLISILAKRLNIPIYHLEAGNRSFDNNVPEEINRKIIDHSSDFNLVYTEHARRNLLAEGIHSRSIFLIGSPMQEVLNKNLMAIQECDVLSRLELNKESYLLLSLHRQENTNSDAKLRKIIENVSLAAQEFGKQVLFSVHPRTLNRIDEFALDLPPSFICVPALGFLEFNNLQLNSFIVLSDSGSISEESAILNFNAVTIRDSMERPEALESGSISMSGSSSINLPNSIKLMRNSLKKSIPTEYQIEDTSKRVVNAILSTLDLYDDWFAIRR